MASSGKRIVKRSRIALRADPDLVRALEDRTDAIIERDAAADPISPAVDDAAAWRGSEIIEPETTVLVTLRVDRAVYEYFARQSQGFEARMAEVLRRHVEGCDGNAGG